MRGRKTLGVCLLTICAALQSCGDTGSADGRVAVKINGQSAQARTERVMRDALGETWPFTVEEAILICVPDLAEYGVFYAIEGHVFAANGSSETMAKLKRVSIAVDGTPTQHPVTLDINDPVSARVWAIDQTLETNESIESALPRKGIGVMLPAVMKLGCGG